MAEERIIEQILEYVKEERFRQAVLIDGDWGSGKTFFVKETLIKRFEDQFADKKTYYISLYGISEPKEIFDEIYAAMMDRVIDKIGQKTEEQFGEKTGEKLERGIRKSRTVISKIFVAGMQYFNIDAKNLPQLSDLKEIEKSIIIFDDLERCEIEINQVLGLINNLVEHSGIRVILVANQKEIGKMNFSKELWNKYLIALDDRIDFKEGKKNKENKENKVSKEQLQSRAELLFEKSDLYQKVKEKLVGLTIYYEPELSEIFGVIVDEYIKDETIKEYILDNEKDIIDIFEQENCHNIRTLIFALVAIEKFCRVIKGIEFSPLDYINEEKKKVLKYTVNDSIKIKKGERLYYWGSSDAKSGIVYRDIEKIREWSIYGYRFVDDYLLQCKLDENNIKDTILENVKERKRIEDEKKIKASLLYQKLMYWWELEDEEIESILQDFPKEVSAGKYTPYDFKSIIVTLMQLQANGFKDFEYVDYIQSMKAILEDYDGSFEKRKLEVLSNDKKFIKDYNEIVKPLFDIIDEKNNKEKKIDNSRLVNRALWNESFELFCQNHRDEYMKDKKFLSYMEAARFIEQLKNANVQQITFFTYGLKAVYNFSNLNDYFVSDSSVLNEIIKQLDPETLSSGKRTRKIALEKLLNELKDALELIKRDSSF